MGSLPAPARALALAAALLVAQHAAAQAPAVMPAAAAAKPAAAAAPTKMRYSLSDTINKGSALEALLANKLGAFARVANASGLTPVLNSTVTRATIFAPTDAAIAKLAADLGVPVAAVLGNQMLVDRLAGYHIVPGATVASTDLKASQMVATARGGDLKVTVANGKDGKPAVTVTGVQNSATVVSPNIRAGKVVIHAIDAVLLPNDVFTNIFNALAYRKVTKPLADLIAADAALTAAVKSPATNVTFFAPTAASLTKTLADKATMAVVAKPGNANKLLSYHLVAGARILPNAVKSQETLQTLNKGQTLQVNKVVTQAADGSKVGTITVLANSKGAKPVKVIKLNIIAGNSMIQLVDGPLVPANMS